MSGPRLERYREAYLLMAKFYRPEAPSDGEGNIQLTPEQCLDQELLEREATDFAAAFRSEEDTLSFHIGCNNFETNRAFLWTIEAARCLAGGADAEAIKLLKLATDDLREAAWQRTISARPNA